MTMDIERDMGMDIEADVDTDMDTDMDMDMDIQKFGYRISAVSLIQNLPYCPTT